MALGMETSGMPVVVSGNGDGWGGMGGLGGVLIGSLLFGRGGFGGYGGYGGGMAVAEGAQLGQLSGIQAQVTGLSDQLASNQTSAEIGNLATMINTLNTANMQGIASNAQIYAQGNANLSTALASNNYTTLSSINGLGRDVTAQANNNALQQLNSFNVLNTSMLQGFNEIGRDTATATNQLIMGQNNLSAQLAACCCDLRSAIKDDGAATRALINDLYVQNLQGQLADAKSQNNNLAQSIQLTNQLGAQTAQIINHLVPILKPVVV